MRQKALAGLFAATIVLAGAAAYVVWRHQASVNSESSAGQLLFPGLLGKVNEVRELSIGNSAKRFTIVNEGGERWVMKEKSGYPARTDAVKKTVVALADLKTLEPRTSNPELYERIGVKAIDQPGSDAIRLGIKDGQGAELAALLVGKVKQADSGVRPAQLYVRRPDQAQAWLAEGRIDIKLEPVAWLEREMLKVPRERLMSMEIVHPGGEKVAVSRPDGKSEDFTFTGLPAEGKPKVTNANGMMAGLELLTFEDVAKAADVGVEKPIRATARTFDGLVITVDLVERDGKPWARFDAALDEAQAAKANVAEKNDAGLKTKAEIEKEVAEIKARVGGWIYQIPDYRAENFNRKPADMVAKDAS